MSLPCNYIWLVRPIHYHIAPYSPQPVKASEGGSALAKKLIELYFTMFRMVIQGHFGRAGEARK
jgi:hypothetical protein